MNKLGFSLFFLFLFLTACGNSSSLIQKEQQNSKTNLPIISFVECFIASYPNFDNNDIERKNADVAFLMEVMSFSDSMNLIHNIPVKLKAMNETKKGNIIAQFSSWPSPRGFDYPNPVKEVNFDIIGEINPEYVKTLNEDNYYIIYGKLISPISFQDVKNKLGKSFRSVYTPSTHVRKDWISKDKYEVDLGLMEYRIDSIALYTP